MTAQDTGAHEASEAARAADLVVTVAAALNERLERTAVELARSQELLREASEELTTAFRGAADRIVAARRGGPVAPEGGPDDYGIVLDHLYRAVQHLQSHDVVGQLIDAQKLRVEKMREKLAQALALASAPVDDPAQPEQWVERSRAMLDCIVAGISQIDDDAHAARHAGRPGSVDLF